jgi:hypothetical protein
MTTPTPNNEPRVSDEKNWSDPDENGNVQMPDELEPLYNKLGFQLRFHTISGKGETATLVHMTRIAEEFFQYRLSQIREEKCQFNTLFGLTFMVTK